MADVYDRIIQGDTSANVIPATLQGLLDQYNNPQAAGGIGNPAADEDVKYEYMPIRDAFGADDYQTTSDVDDLLMKINPTGTFSGILGTGAIAGAQEAEAAQMKAQSEALRTLLQDLAPYKNLGSAALPQASRLATREGQAEYLQNDPMTKFLQGIGLQTTNNQAVGRTAGTQEALEDRLLGIGDSLVNQQFNRSLSLAKTGQASAAQTAQGGANLAAGFGDISAAGGIGAANAKGQAGENVTGIVSLISSFSDPRLKDNVKMIGKYGELGIYTWTWNDEASGLGLSGRGFGHMADEVERVFPELVTEKDGYKQVGYNVIGKTLMV